MTIHAYVKGRRKIQDLRLNCGIVRKTACLGLFCDTRAWTWTAERDGELLIRTCTTQKSSKFIVAGAGEAVAGLAGVCTGAGAGAAVKSAKSDAQKSPPPAGEGAAGIGACWGAGAEEKSPKLAHPASTVGAGPLTAAGGPAGAAVKPRRSPAKPGLEVAADGAAGLKPSKSPPIGADC